MNFLEKFQQHNKDARDVYANDAVEEAMFDFAKNVAKAMKAEKITEDKAKRILIEGFDIKPSFASEIWEHLS